jgi:hypothetical protein
MITVPFECSDRRGRLFVVHAELTWYDPGYAATRDEPGCGPDVEYVICNHRGNPAPYLERLMTPEDEAGLLKAVLDECKRMDRVGEWDH